MITKEEKEKYESLQKHIRALPNQHLTIKQEKKLYAERMERRKEMLREAGERVKQEPETIFINHLRKRINLEDVTDEIREKEIAFYID